MTDERLAEIVEMREVLAASESEPARRAGYIIDELVTAYREADRAALDHFEANGQAYALGVETMKQTVAELRHKLIESEKRAAVLLLALRPFALSFPATELRGVDSAIHLEYLGLPVADLTISRSTLPISDFTRAADAIYETPAGPGESETE